MTALQIRSMPSDLYEWLVGSAKHQHRSISQQALVILKNAHRKDSTQVDSGSHMEETQYVRLPFDTQTDAEEIAKNQARRRAVHERIQAMPKIDIPEDFPSPAEMIREDRSR